MTARTDILVVGGGPAGLAAAIAGRRAGFKVTLVERHRPPLDKPCGEGIMPDGVRLLDELGVRLPAGATFTFRGISYIQGDILATARFRQGAGLGVRRTLLHEALTRRASEVGVDLHWGERLHALDGGSALLGGGRIAARWVVAADGVGSPLRRALGLDAQPLSRRIGYRRHYDRAPWSDHVEVHWCDRGEVYVTPVSRDRLCVAGLVHDPALRLEDLLAGFPALAERLAGVPRSDERGAATIFRRLPRVTRGNVALLGDAAGSVDAITGEGITLALHQAVLLARALRGGDLSRYDVDCRRLLRVSHGMTRFMLAVDRRPALRRMTLKVLARSPGIFGVLLGLHTRSLPISHGGAMRVGGWRPGLAAGEVS